MVGGASGDALGYAVEFLDEASIFARHGENGITAYDCRNGIAEISDDTQMTLFTATGLLLGKTEERRVELWEHTQVTFASVIRIGIGRKSNNTHVIKDTM